MNMMRNKNRGGNRSHRGGGGRRYNNGSGGGNRQQNDGQNLARQKHHATQMLGKYSDLMRNAQNNGDRVDVEYYLQHIDHYNRVLADIAVIEAERYAERQAQYGAQTQEAPTGTEGEGDAAAGGAGDEFAGNNPPRMQRHHHRPRYQQQAAAPSEAGSPQAFDGNANNEIPLPGNILPPI